MQINYIDNTAATIKLPETTIKATGPVEVAGPGTNIIHIPITMHTPPQKEEKGHAMYVYIVHLNVHLFSDDK